MARLILALIVVAVCIAIAALFYSIWTNIVQAGTQTLRGGRGPNGEYEMGSTGIQKAAYIALITVLFGVATGWLGGL
ncbi:hypothetical protein Z946_3193 [Sulfitobacter noctilucicola]|uniref:H+/Cl- antiporter ClcA n=1 Tax=Sulfitobacter noctilucicola TaxID=1342301 RepID=A0A7W6MAN1_9RHOB|nr:hypothetical protein [Sulfitobacter noctilucicola]KIN64302.1 hypothetical protein Z946_3193 [Sulfitobacter noctilucicola]MBB4174531.1 H+/Cl- antiporter ClcA [Sulfitobacter noctilucicola]